MAKRLQIWVVLGISLFLMPAFALARNYPPISAAKASVTADLLVLAAQQAELEASECTVDPALLGGLKAFAAARTNFSTALESDYSEMMTFVTTPIPGNGKCDQSALSVAEGALRRSNRLITSINIANKERKKLVNANNAVNAIPNFESVDVDCGTYVNSQLQAITGMVQKTNADTQMYVTSLTGTKDQFLVYQSENIRIANSCHNSEGTVIVEAPNLLDGGKREPATFVKNPHKKKESTITGEITNEKLP